MTDSIQVSSKLFDRVADKSLHKVASDLPAGSGFLNLDWYAAWEECYLPIDNPGTPVQCIALSDTEDRTIGVCPFFIKSYFGLRLLSVAGYYYPFRSFIVAKNSVAKCTKGLVEAIHKKSMASIVRFGPAEEDNPVTRNLFSTFMAQGWKCYQQDRGEQYFINLPQEFAQYKNTLSKKMLGNLRRDTNKLAKIGSIEYKKFNNLQNNEWVSVIDDCSAIEGNSWLDKSSQGKMRIYGKEAFWKRLLENRSTSKNISIWVMYLDNKPISYNVAIDADGYRYGVSSQYDASYRKYSVGLAMHFHVIEDAINAGIKIFNMGDGDSGYKQRWGATAGTRLVDYIYFKPNVLGYCIYSGLTLKDKLQSIVQSSRSKFNVSIPLTQSISLTKFAKK